MMHAGMRFAALMSVTPMRLRPIARSRSEPVTTMFSTTRSESSGATVVESSVSRPS